MLTKLQQTKSKSKNLLYTRLELQAYLKSNNTNIKEKSFIFASRSRMIDVKGNFKNGLTDLMCRKCSQSVEDQEHILSCPALADNSVVNTGYVPVYSDLFSEDVKKIESIGKILIAKFKIFNSKNVPMCTGTNHVLLQSQLQNWN